MQQKVNQGRLSWRDFKYSFKKWIKKGEKHPKVLI